MRLNNRMTKQFSKTDPRSMRLNMTLTEVLIASFLAVTILAGFMSFLFMVRNGVKSGQSQVWLHDDARYGTQKLTRLIQEARIAAARNNGTEIYIINPDDTASLIYFENSDSDHATTSDNSIWYDPDTGIPDDEKILVKKVSQIDGQPIFTNIRGGVALSYHIGDPPNPESWERKTAKGYQGLQIHVVAKPRNIGHIWTSEGYN